MGGGGKCQFGGKASIDVPEEGALLGVSVGMSPRKFCETRYSEIDSRTYLTFHNLKSTFEYVFRELQTYLS